MLNRDINNFRIAEFGIRIIFEKKSENSMKMLPSFDSFRVDELNDDEFLFELTVDDDLRPVPKEQRERIRDFDTGNGITIVDQLNNGGYQYIIKDINGSECCLLIADKEFRYCRCALNGGYNMRYFGLNNALMLVYAFAASTRQTLLIHASLVRQNGYGYAFIAKSGTGKSTQVSNWLRYLPGCDLMNDDNPIIRMIDGKPFVFGGPWSGKTPCYRNVKAPLGAITRIDRAEQNSIDKVGVVEAFASLLPSVSSMKWDKTIFDHICNTLTKIIETTGIYTLHCRPDKESAVICNKVISIKQGLEQ
jgi:hypothetical protein